MFCESTCTMSQGGTGTMALSILIVDKKLTSTCVRSVSSSSFLFLCTRAADQHFTSLITVHLSTIKDFAAAMRYHHRCEVRSLTVTEPDGDSRGPFEAKRGSNASDLCPMHALSPFILFGRACIYRRVKAVTN